MKMKVLSLAHCICFVTMICTVNLSQAELPLSVQKDLLLHDLITAIKADDYAKIIDTANSMRSKNIDTGTEIYFYEARSYFALNNNQAGDKALEEYVSKAGSTGRNYQEAIAMLSDRLGKRDQENRDRQAAAASAALEQRQWAAFNTSRKQIGKVDSINTDWGFAKASLSVASIPDGSFLFIQIAPNRYQPVQPGKLTATHITLTGIGSAQFPLGAAVVTSNVQPPDQTLGAVADADPSSGTKGVLVLSLKPSSAAARAGLQAGDIIKHYGFLDIKNVQDLDAAIAARGAKKTITEKIDRNGNVIKPSNSGGLAGLGSALGGAMTGQQEVYETRERPITKDDGILYQLMVGEVDQDTIMLAVERNNYPEIIQVKPGALDAELVNAK